MVIGSLGCNNYYSNIHKKINYGKRIINEWKYKTQDDHAGVY